MIRQGEPLASVAPELAEGVRFYVLALAPNAARLSIRFYFEDDFGAIAANYQRFLADMRIEPPPRDGQPALWKYLAETAGSRSARTCRPISPANGCAPFSPARAIRRRCSPPS